MNQEGENGGDGGNNACKVDVYILDEIHHPQLFLLIFPQVCQTQTDRHTLLVESSRRVNVEHTQCQGFPRSGALLVLLERLEPMMYP